VTKPGLLVKAKTKSSWWVGKNLWCGSVSLGLRCREAAARKDSSVLQGGEGRKLEREGRSAKDKILKDTLLRQKEGWWGRTLKLQKRDAILLRPSPHVARTSQGRSYSTRTTTPSRGEGPILCPNKKIRGKGEQDSRSVNGEKKGLRS